MMKPVHPSNSWSLRATDFPLEGAVEIGEMVDEEIKGSHVSMITTEITKRGRSIDHYLEICLKEHPTISA